MVQECEIDERKTRDHVCEILPGTQIDAKELVSGDIYEGNRSTFLSEESVRIVEDALGIVRDHTPVQQQTRFNTGSYNYTNVKAGHGS